MAMNQVEQDDLNASIELLTKEATTWARTGEESEEFVKGLRYATRKMKNGLKHAGTGKIAAELEASRRPRGRPPVNKTDEPAKKAPAKKTGAVKKVPRGQTRFDTPAPAATKKAPAKTPAKKAPAAKKGATISNITDAAKKAGAKKAPAAKKATNVR